MHRLLAPLLLALAVPATAQSSATVSTSGHGQSRASIGVTVPMGKSTRINHFTLTPVEVVEDSRCPRQVTCVWRGRLVVKFAVRGEKPIVLESEKPVPFGGGTLTLVDAWPHSQRGERVPPARYRFQLRFER